MACPPLPSEGLGTKIWFSSTYCETIIENILLRCRDKMITQLQRHSPFPLHIMILNKRLQQNADPWWQCVKLGDISTRKLHYTVYSNQSRARNILYCSVLNKNWPLGVIFLLCTTVKRSNRSVGLRPLLFPRYLRIQYKNIKKLSNSLYNCRCILKEGVSRGYASKGPWLTGFREMKNSRLTQCGHLPR